MAVTPPRPLAWITIVGLALVAGVSRPAFAADPAAGPASRSISLRAAAEDAGQAAAQTATPQPASAPEPETSKWPVSGGVTVDLMSHYVWRGFLLTDAFAFQPTIWGKVGNLTASSWSTWSADQEGGPLMEHDFTVDYSQAVGKATIGVGYINYLFPAVDGDGDVTNEIYVTSAFATILNPTVKVYFDFHEGDGTYLNFGVSHPIPLGSKGITATPAFAIGYNHQQWIDESAWNDANFSIKLTIPINARITLGPGIYYSKGLNDAIPDQFYGGLSIVTTF
jgi:hypothetical protein